MPPLPPSPPCTATSFTHLRRSERLSPSSNVFDRLQLVTPAISAIQGSAQHLGGWGSDNSNLNCMSYL